MFNSKSASANGSDYLWYDTQRPQDDVPNVVGGTNALAAFAPHITVVSTSSQLTTKPAPLLDATWPGAALDWNLASDEAAPEQILTTCVSRDGSAAPILASGDPTPRREVQSDKRNAQLSLRGVELG